MLLFRRRRGARARPYCKVYGSDLSSIISVCHVTFLLINCARLCIFPSTLQLAPPPSPSAGTAASLNLSGTAAGPAGGAAGAPADLGLLDESLNRPQLRVALADFSGFAASAPAEQRNATQLGAFSPTALRLLHQGAAVCGWRRAGGCRPCCCRSCARHGNPRTAGLRSTHMYM